MNPPRDAFCEYLPLSPEFNSIPEITWMDRLPASKAASTNRDSHFAWRRSTFLIRRIILAFPPLS